MKEKQVFIKHDFVNLKYLFQAATLNFERAASMHEAAKEMVIVAEQGMSKDKSSIGNLYLIFNLNICNIQEVFVLITVKWLKFL